MSKFPWSYVLLRMLASIVLPPVVMLYAIRGKYPWWMVTPDDPESPFASKFGTLEPTMVKIYEKFGRWAGDVYWLGIRNTLYGWAYSKIPEFLRDPGVRYEDLRIWRESPTEVRLLSPDGTLYTERTFTIIPNLVYLLYGWRLRPILDGHLENRDRLNQGLPRYPRPPTDKLNMDGRPILSFRSFKSIK